MIAEQKKETRKHYIDNLRNLLTVLAYHLIKLIPVVRKMIGIK